MRGSRHITLLALFVAFCASTGFLRVAHDLTSHLCSCVSGLVLDDGCPDAEDACHASDGHESDKPHNHKHPAGEQDCDICAVLHAAHHATPIEAPALIVTEMVAIYLPIVQRAVYADARSRAWTARGPPITR